MRGAIQKEMFAISDLRRREIIHLRSICPFFRGRGYSYIFIHTYYVGLGYFWGFKILNFNIFWVLQKTEFFGGMKILWIYFGGHHKTGLYLEVISSILGAFLKVNVQNGGYFLGCEISNIYLMCLKFLIFFAVNGRCRALAYV